MSVNRLKYKDYIFVGIQLLLFAGYVLPVKITTIILHEWLCYLGLVLVAFGVVLGAVALLQINKKLSPFPTPVSTGKLITNGAFLFARHPIYTAILMVTLGYAVFQESIFKTMIFIALCILFYFKSRYEEHLLSEKYPSYSLYMKDVG